MSDSAKVYIWLASLLSKDGRVKTHDLGETLVRRRLILLGDTIQECGLVVKVNFPIDTPFRTQVVRHGSRLHSQRGEARDRQRFRGLVRRARASCGNTSGQRLLFQARGLGVSIHKMGSPIVVPVS